MKLERSENGNGNKIYYDYLFCKNTNTETCNERKTGGSYQGDYSTIYLDKVDML